MSEPELQSSSPSPPWFVPTPGKLLIGLPVVECLLWLSERFQWLPFNEQKGWTVLIAVASVGAAMLVMLLWLVVSLAFRLRFQFTVRSLLVLLVAVALPSSWLAVEMAKVRGQEQAVKSILKSHGHVQYDFQRRSKAVAPQPPASAWLRRLLGDHFFVRVESVSFVDPGNTDDDLAPLSAIVDLKVLVLSCASVTDAGLVHLQNLAELETLRLSLTNVTDTGLEYLQGLTKLESLDLSSTSVTNAGLEHLDGLQQLRSLNVMDTSVDDEGVKRLHKALPRCRISSGPTIWQFQLGPFVR